nr:MucB/RseB C-terminal domain-containing protein [Pandoraea thiooxydans]
MRYLNTERSSRAALGRVFVGLFLLVMLVQARTWASTPVTPSSTDPLIARREVNAWLTKIHRAAQTQNYVGTFVYQRGSFIRSSRISHFADRGHEYEQLETLDGQPRKILRHDEDVYSFIPEHKIIFIEKRENKDSFPALLAAGEHDVLNFYEPKLLAPERVAGFNCVVIDLVPRDAYRFGYRLWADERSGLLLRAQTVDAKGHVLEQASFSQVSIGVPSQKNRIMAEIHDVRGWRIVKPHIQTVHLADTGWSIKANVPGFKEIREVRRVMNTNPGSGPIEVLQAVYSDGMSGLSVFIEPATRERKEGHGSTGATNILIKKYDNFWLTLLGEVPQATLQRFAASIEYKPVK